MLTPPSRDLQDRFGNRSRRAGGAGAAVRGPVPAAPPGPPGPGCERLRRRRRCPGDRGRAGALGGRSTGSRRPPPPRPAPPSLPPLELGWGLRGLRSPGLGIFQAAEVPLTVLGAPPRPAPPGPSARPRPPPKGTWPGGTSPPAGAGERPGPRGLREEWRGGARRGILEVNREPLLSTRLPHSQVHTAATAYLHTSAQSPEPPRDAPARHPRDPKMGTLHPPQSKATQRCPQLASRAKHEPQGSQAAQTWPKPPLPSDSQLRASTRLSSRLWPWTPTTPSEHPRAGPHTSHGFD